MKKESGFVTSICCFMILLLIVPSYIQADEKPELRSIEITTWLAAGPVPVHLPLFHDVKNIKGGTFELEQLLAFEYADVNEWQPVEGRKIPWDAANTLQWSIANADSQGTTISTKNAETPHIAYLATYIETMRFAKVKLGMSSFHLFEAYIDGEKILDKKKASHSENDSLIVEPGNQYKDITLENGKHLLLVKTLRDPECTSPWNLKAHLEVPADWPEDDVFVTLSSTQKMTVTRLLDGPKVTGASISPDGELAAVNLSQTLPPSDNAESWLELRRVKDGSLVQVYRGGMSISRVNWAPKGSMFSYVSSGQDGSTLWVVDLSSGSTTALLKNIKDLGGHTWAPDGTFIIYSISEKPEKNNTGMRKIDGMEDHWPWFKNRSFLYRLNVPQGTRTRLTAGALTTNLNSISPDSKTLIFTRSFIDYSERPYAETVFYTLDLSTMKLDSLFTSKWANYAMWSPDGKKLLVTGGPSSFGDIGVNVPDGIIPNDYDMQAFIYDLATKEVEAITKNFDPEIGQAVWSKTEPCIYFTTTDKSYRRLYRYDLKKKSFEAFDTGVEVIDFIDIADRKPLAVYTGNGSAAPPRAYVLDLRKKKYHLLTDPGAQDYAYMKFGDVKRWTFENEEGVEIEGRVYCPPNFDASQKYPCIVYYYGGTSPVTRDFGGRYPKQLWAANGYVVYVLQPSGATGFGQKFSAFHVNDWGKTGADEIIDGTKKFLAAHPFVDAKRVGCIGASYGGFMTMLLVTKTDIFASAISHAGISALTSYWGEGYWGYSYSAVATANSFPWNRRDIYVDQSPLFHANNITTPLLLLHGAVDTNVPPGESRQLYAALKLLGREVELIEIEGQNHHIMQYNKRIRWTKTIMAWFDRWLKDQPEWWNDMYTE